MVKTSADVQIRWAGIVDRRPAIRLACVPCGKETLRTLDAPALAVAANQKFLTRHRRCAA